MQVLIFSLCRFCLRWQSAISAICLGGQCTVGVGTSSKLREGLHQSWRRGFNEELYRKLKERLQWRTVSEVEGEASVKNCIGSWRRGFSAQWPRRGIRQIRFLPKCSYVLSTEVQWRYGPMCWSPGSMKCIEVEEGSQQDYTIAAVGCVLLRWLFIYKGFLHMLITHSTHKSSVSSHISEFS